jgi:hypothetical protein
MRRRSTRLLLAWSLVGLIGGHQAAYLAVYREPRIVVEALGATGHGWMWLAPLFCFSAALVALVVGFRGSDPVRSFRWRFAALATIQVLTFVALEAAERLTTGADASRVARDLVAGPDAPVLVVGAVLQVLTAAVLALASRLVDRLASALRERLRSRRRVVAAPFRLPAGISALADLVPAGPGAARAPPLRS